jgi:hypothetical protein
MTLCGAWTASVTETPGNTPVGLMFTGGTDLWATLASLLPPRVVPAHLIASSRALDAGLALFALVTCAIAVGGRDSARGRRAAVVIGAGLAHLALLALLAPQRPDVPARYLLPLWPLIAVGVAVGVARFTEGDRERGTLRIALGILLLAAWALPGAVTQIQLLQPERARAFFSYDASRYAGLDIGKVTYETAPGVNDFLARRSDITGFRLVAGTGAGQDLLMRPPPHPVDAARLPAQIEHALGRFESRETSLENVGWGLAVFAADRPGARRSVLLGLGGADREAVARGIGMGLQAAGRSLDLWDQDPDAAAIREGAARIETETATAPAVD